MGLCFGPCRKARSDGTIQHSFRDGKVDRGAFREICCVFSWRPANTFAKELRDVYKQTMAYIIQPRSEDILLMTLSNLQRFECDVI